MHVWNYTWMPLRLALWEASCTRWLRGRAGERRRERDPTLRFSSKLTHAFLFVSFQWIFNFMCFQVFILRIFMWLIVGVISGAWAWSTKSLSSWKHLANRFRQIDLGRWDWKIPFQVFWFLDRDKEAGNPCLSHRCLPGIVALKKLKPELTIPCRWLLETMVGCSEELWPAALKPGLFLAVQIQTE